MRRRLTGLLTRARWRLLRFLRLARGAELGERRGLGVLHLPEVAANFTWGDDDLKSLYVTASAGLYRKRVKVAGRRLSNH